MALKLRYDYKIDIFNLFVVFWTIYILAKNEKIKTNSRHSKIDLFLSSFYYYFCVLSRRKSSGEIISIELELSNNHLSLIT